MIYNVVLISAVQLSDSVIHIYTFFTLWLYVESKIWTNCTYLQSRNRLIDIENRLVVAKGEGEGWTGSLGLADANYYI